MDPDELFERHRTSVIHCTRNLASLLRLTPASTSTSSRAARHPTSSALATRPNSAYAITESCPADTPDDQLNRTRNLKLRP